MVKALLVYIHTDSLKAEPETVMELLVLANQYTLTKVRVVGYGAVWCGMVRYGAVWWCGVVWRGIV